MQSQQVFQDQVEIERLAVQNRLLSLYESTVLESLLSDGVGQTVLDIGCNDGAKTVRRFASSAISRVVGLEYNPSLAADAQRRYGDDKFSFYSCDVEAPDFANWLGKVCDEASIAGFDVIYLSFLLMHLKDPAGLLRQLKPFLKENGCVLIIEPNDRASRLTPDPEGLLPAFFDILEQDRYAGNRFTGARVPQLLRQTGYGESKLWYDAIEAGPGENEKKQAIFQTFFSYLPEDVALLRRLEPDDPRYRSWQTWLQIHFDTLRDAVLRKNTHIRMGLQILSCGKGEA